MSLEPRDLLACVERMTPIQRACLCELLDPVTPARRRRESAAVLQPKLDAAVYGPQGPQGPPFEGPENSIVLGGCQRVPPPGFVFRPPSPDVVAQLLYKQMTGKHLVIPAEMADMPQTVADSVKQMLTNFPAEDITPADDDTLVMPPTSTQPPPHHARWMNARVRWAQLFGEAEIPMVRRPKAVLDDLDLIEGMLYDKGVKNLDPARCSCGCGYVAGCGAVADIHNIEG
jgi:hypothetical protein